MEMDSIAGCIRRCARHGIDNHSQCRHGLHRDNRKDALMIVCVCNRLNEAKIRGAIACGASSPDDVYTHHGCRRICGTCQTTIRTMLRQAQEAESQLQAAE
jgi:bacterioferritin-associated ferredoxin